MIPWYPLVQLVDPMTEHSTSRCYLISYFALALNVSENPLISLWHGLEPDYKARSVAKEFRASDFIQSLPSSLSPDSVWQINPEESRPKDLFTIRFDYKGVSFTCGRVSIVDIENEVLITCPHHPDTHRLDEWKWCIKSCIESLKTFDAVSKLMTTICNQKFGKLEHPYRNRSGKWFTEVPDCPTRDRLRFEISFIPDVITFKWITRIDYIKTRYSLTTDFCTTEMNWSGPYYRQLGHSFEAKPSDVFDPYQFARVNGDFKHRFTRDAWLKTMGKRLKESIPPANLPRSRDSSPSKR
jgi:hypothetical protein